MQSTFDQELLDLIQRPTTADKPEELHAVIYHFADYIRHHHLSVELFDKDGIPSLLAYRGDKRPETFHVLLNGHLDVVPARPAQFHANITDGKLYGRGVLDMKAASLAFVHTFVKVAHQVPYALGLQLVTDEEMGGYHGTKHQLEQGVQADFVLGGETTDGNIDATSRGIVWAEVRASGTTAHGAYPWCGHNAITALTEQIDQLLAEYPVPKVETWVTTVNVAEISTTNTASNKVPDNATAILDIRFTPDDPHFQTKAIAQTYLESIFPHASVHLKGYEVGHACEPDNSFIKHLIASRQAITGIKPKLIKKYGSSDLRFYSQHHIPSVNFGLSGDGIHSDHEYLELSSIQPYHETLEHFLTHLK